MKPYKAQILNLTKVIIGTLKAIVGEKVLNKVLNQLRTSLPRYYARCVNAHTIPNLNVLVDAHPPFGHPHRIAICFFSCFFL